MADTSQITLDVIEAIQQNKTVSFKYGGHDRHFTNDIRSN
jgi:hypothetical protein